MSKLTHAEAVKVIRGYAKRLVRFHEGSHNSEENCLIVGFIIEGKFGVGDPFFDAMRSLRKPASRALKQSQKVKK